MESKRFKFLNCTCLFVLTLSACFFLPVNTAAQEPFYKGKTITFIQGREPGGTGDLRARALIPFLRKYIPGNPNVVSEYMPGGGGRKVTNYIFKQARPDGLTIGNVGAGLVGNAVLGETGVQYDLDKLIYLGTPNSESHYVFTTKRELGLNNLDKLRAYSGLRIGAQTVGHDVYLFGRLFAWFLDLKSPKFILGYSGPEINLAMTQGEVDGRANIAGNIPQRTPEWLTKGLMDFHAIVEIPKGERHPLFAKLPELESFARSPKEVKLLSLQRTFRLAGSPNILPPGTPRERVEILRTAMRKTFTDQAFLAEFKKLTGDDATPLTGEQLEKFIKEIPREQEVIKLFTKIGGAEPLPPR